MGTNGTARKRLGEVLGALPLIYPSEATWRTLDAWTERTTGAGQFFSLGDLLIGILAAEAGALIWSIDQDFQRLERLKLVQLYA